MGSYLDSVNRTKVKPELLVEVLQIVEAMAPEDRGVYEARAFRVVDLLKNKGLRTGRIVSLATAIDFRLTALERLDLDGGLRGWSVPRQEPGVSSLSIEAVKAAAEEPLIENAEGKAAFDAERFQRRILTNIQPDGRA
jgi:hypothetical protein